MNVLVSWINLYSNMVLVCPQLNRWKQDISVARVFLDTLIQLALAVVFSSIHPLHLSSQIFLLPLVLTMGFKALLKRPELARHRALLRQVSKASRFDLSGIQVVALADFGCHGQVKAGNWAGEREHRNWAGWEWYCGARERRKRRGEWNRPNLGARERGTD
jgi:hypothetical protein